MHWMTLVRNKLQLWQRYSTFKGWLLLTIQSNLSLPCFAFTYVISSNMWLVTFRRWTLAEVWLDSWTSDKDHLIQFSTTALGVLTSISRMILIDRFWTYLWIICDAIRYDTVLTKMIPFIFQEVWQSMEIEPCWIYNIYFHNISIFLPFCNIHIILLHPLSDEIFNFYPT